MERREEKRILKRTERIVRRREMAEALESSNPRVCSFRAVTSNQRYYARKYPVASMFLVFSITVVVQELPSPCRGMAAEPIGERNVVR